MRIRASILIWLPLLTFGLFIQGCVLPGMMRITATPPPVVVSITEAVPYTSTPVPSPILTQTALPDLTPATTPSPTDIPERVTEFVLEMLETNGDCDLPCFWGITPGETSWTELEKELTAAGLMLEDERLDLGPWKDITGHSVSVRFHRDNVVVDEIQIHCELEAEVVFVEGMVDICGAYALPSALNRFGVPSQVNLSMSRLDSLYELWMTYGFAGITVSYPGLMVTDIDGWTLCPVHSRQKQINIHLHDPGSEPSNMGFGSSDGVFIAQGSLERLTGTSASEFHAAFSDPQSRNCLFSSDAFQRTYDEVLLAPEGNRLWPQAETDILAELLNTDYDCDVPCWWGIKPGKTSWEAAREHFLALGKSIAIYSDNTLNLGGVRRVAIFGRHDPYPYEYMLEHEIYEYGGLVSLIGARAQTFGGQPMEELLQDWTRYTAYHILARYGIPSEVMLHYWSDDADSPYTVGLIYERDGLLVEYEGQVKLLPEANLENSVQDGQAVICLDEDHISGINVWVRSPWGSTAMSEVFKQLGGTFPKHFYSTPTLEDATGMSLEAFYEKFLEPRPEICLVADRRLGDLAE